MRALGFEPKKEEIRKMIADIDKDGSGMLPRPWSHHLLGCFVLTIAVLSVFLNALYKLTCIHICQPSPLNAVIFNEPSKHYRTGAAH